jgi:predicted dehydrogenase
MNSPALVSIGIIGAGFMAATTHIPTILATEGTAIAWITDIDGAKAKRTGKAFGIPHCPLPRNLEDLPHADVVLVTVPFGYREPIYEAFRKRHSALMVEKPFSRSLAHHQRLCGAFPDYKLGCMFMLRSGAPNLSMKSIINSGVFGCLRSIAFEMGNPGIVVGGRFSSDVRAAGGGMLFEVGIHGVDSALFVSGAASVKVTKCEIVCDAGLDIHTNALAIITLPDRSEVPFRFKASYLTETTNRIEFFFDHAVVHYSIFAHDAVLEARSTNTGDRIRLDLIGATYPTTKYTTFHSHWSNFLSGVRSANRNYTSAAECVPTTSFVEQVYSRSKQGEDR